MESLAKEATSAIAVLRSISIRISEGILAIGQGGGGVPSVGGAAADTVVLEKEAIKSLVVEVEGPSRE